MVERDRWELCWSAPCHRKRDSGFPARYRLSSDRYDAKSQRDYPAAFVFARLVHYTMTLSRD
jgi:hypothetical protein